MTTHFVRKLLGNLTQKEFSKKFNIPLGTVKNWDARDCMPEYILDFANEIYRVRRLYNDIWLQINEGETLEIMI